MTKDFFKELLTLDKPVLTNTLGPRLRPYAKIVYYVFAVILAVMLLGSLTLLVKPTVFLLTLVLLVIDFVILRMFCESLIHKAPAAGNSSGK